MEVRRQMDDSSAISTTAANLDQADTDVLACTVSDEALEAAAGTEWRPFMTLYLAFTFSIDCC
jgi:hypothetical protein